jgi:uncharacterized membrane protein YkvA (DUF1232 family)
MAVASGKRQRRARGAESSERTQARESRTESELAHEERAPRTGAKRTVMSYVRQLPHYLRLFVGLIGDRRVATIDKLLVFGAVAYIITPIDLIPDFIPFLGEVDDIYLLVLALQRLMANAGRLVLLDHWGGDPNDLRDLNLRRALSAAAFFLPRRIRRRLRVIGRA